MSAKKKLFAAVLVLSAAVLVSGAARAEGWRWLIDGAPKYKSDDGRFSFKLRGRFYWDAAEIDDREGFEDTSASEVRAARVGFEGIAWRDFGYKFEVDFAGGDAQLKSASMDYSGFKPFKITVGLVKQANSMESLASSRFIAMMERASYIGGLGLTRRWGASLSAGGDTWSVTTTYLGADPNATASFEGQTISARAHLAPRLSETAVLHLGVSAFYRDNDRRVDTVRHRQRPHAHLARNRYVDTGDFTANSERFAGLEGALIAGSFSLDAEYGWLKSDRPTGTADPTFGGGYVSASWFVTGDTRNYKANLGSFDRPKILEPVLEGGWGGLELAARLDFIDLSSQDILGGRQTTYILGANWYPTSHVRFMINYSHAKITGGPLGDGDNSVNAIMFRSQVDW